MKHFLRKSNVFLLVVTLLFSIQGKAQLKAAFTSDVSSGCSPLLVNFHNQSRGTDDHTEFYWDLGNGGSPSTEINPSALFLNPGSGSVTYTIKLVAKNASGVDSIVKTAYITVYANPKVSFTTNVKEGCPPLNIKFTDATKAGSGTITTWLWDFGNGRISGEQNPSITYHTSNTNNISLSVVNSFGCKQTSDGLTAIHVLDTVKAGFDYQYTNICQSPAPIEFQNTSQSASPLGSYNWNFGDGQKATDISPTHTFQKQGTYQVQLITKNTAGCSDTTLQSITVGKSGADFTYANVCTNSAVQFTDASSAVPASSAWTFGDGSTSNETSPSHVYAFQGTYDVTLEASFGNCVGTITKKVTIVNRPDASFSASSSEVCKLPYTVNFRNTTSGADSYKWIFGDDDTSADKNASHIYTQSGFYDVLLIASAGNGCSDTSILKNAVKLGPPVIDSIQGLSVIGCTPFTINPIPFIKTAEAIATYKWIFGDGSTSTDEKPNHTYTKAGDYNVSLIVTTAGGCSDTLTIDKAVKVGTAPKAAFFASPLDVCARISVSFTDSSQGTVTDWLWQFGDGGESNLPSPAHHYMDTGFFTVKLIVSNNGCKDSAVKYKYVYIRPPVASYQSSFSCSKPYERSFTDKSIGADTWSWDFGDGITSNDKNPTHTFAQTGTYVVKLRVTNEQCYDSLQVKMQVVDEHPAFTSSIDAKPSCRNDLVTFTATNINTANIGSYNWIYGDDKTSGFITNGVQSNHIYTSAGLFTPQLITKDVLGCLDTVVGKINSTIYGPIASFKNDSGACINSVVTFFDSSKTDGTHKLKKWEWTYEPTASQSFTSAATYSHQYTKEGFYDIKLTIYDSYGCKDSIVKPKALQITNPKAVISLTDSLKCVKNTISVKNSSTGENLTYKWNFGDNTESTSGDATVTHAYAAEGIYSIYLAVTDKFKCKSDTIRRNSVTISNPKAVISINGPTETTCPPLLVMPTSKSQSYTSLSWNFGDGSLARIDSPSHNYIMGGNFDLTLVAKGYGECYDTAHQLIKLKGPSGKLSYNPLVHCNPSTVNFSCETKDAVKVTWDFNDGVVEPDNGTRTTSHVYKNNGKYLPKLLLTDKDGCFVGLENLDTIHVSGAKADYIATAQAACDSSLAAFVETSIPYYDEIQSYQWTFGDGNTSTQKNPEHYYTTSGTYQAKLSLITKTGCKDSVTRPINVVVHQTPLVSISAIDSVCAKTSVAFNGSDTLNEPGSQWQWNFEKDSAIGVQANHAFTAGGSYKVNLMVTTASGCADTATHLVNVVALPNVSAGLDSFVCNGSTTMLQATGANSYNWTENNTLSCTGCATPIAAPSENTTYRVTGTNKFGCLASDTVAIEVIKKQTIAVANDTLCLNENKNLTASGADLYSWTPALYLDNANSESPVFHAAKDTTVVYVVKGMDRKKCFTDTKLLAVKVFPIPHIEIAEKDINLNVGFSVPISMKSSPDVTQWRWEPQKYLSDAHIENPVASPTQTLTYSCVASNNGSCFARDQVTIHVMCNAANMFVPNTFSPNKDGVNDRFFPRGTGVFNIKSLRIFNRWGQLVYERTNFLPNAEGDGWDGTFNGLPVDSDVYVYMMEIICQNNSVIPFKGNVTLLR